MKCMYLDYRLYKLCGNVDHLLMMGTVGPKSCKKNAILLRNFLPFKEKNLV